MLDREFKFFIDNQKALAEKYQGKFLVIVGEEVVASFDTETEAYFYAIDKYEIGSFLLQLCEVGAQCYTVHMHTPPLDWAPRR